jgi:uncharacterized membrane protein
MFKVLLPLPFLALTACVDANNPNNAAITGAAAGAALGAAVADDNLEGALIGGAAGAVVGDLIGRTNQPGQCAYQDAYGNRYFAPCP